MPVPVLEATGIHQVLAWDITLLPGPAKEQFFYLCMVKDVLSRRMLDIEVYEQECGQLTSTFFDRISRDEEISWASATVLHSDNEAPMHSFTLAAKLAELDVTSSLS